MSNCVQEETIRLSRVVDVVSAHAEGEVGRVVTGGVLGIPGNTMQEKLEYLANSDDSLLRLTLFEPRGSAQMSVNILLPSTVPEADAAFIPLQPDGPHAMSGSNAMCVVTVLLETGMIPMKEPRTTVVLDTAAGLVRAVADCARGRCERVSLDLIPSFVGHLGHRLDVPGHGALHVDVAYAGCWFAFVDAGALGYRIAPPEARELVELGTRIRDAAQEQIEVRHPLATKPSRVEYALFTLREGDGLRTANIIFPGRVDRSPCGTGTAAQLAVLHARGEIQVGERVQSRSIIDSKFTAEITAETTVGGCAAIIPRISGRAWIFGYGALGIDDSDPFASGYTLPDTWGDGFS